MNSLFFNIYINLILLGVLADFRQNFSAALPFEDLASLYNATDKVTVLTSQNFTSTVYHSNTAWLIEFYASWCGHCQAYADVYRTIASDIWAWKTIIRIGAINCYAEENHALCRQHHVPGYPLLRLIPPDAVLDNSSKAITLPATDAKSVEKGIIKELETLNRKNKTWPRFVPVNRITLEELYAQIPKTIKHLIVIVERRDDFTGRLVMLDFSQYREQIATFRTTTDGKLWRKFHTNLADVPALFVILRNRTAERIDVNQNISDYGDHRNLFNHLIRSYMNKTKSPHHFDGHDLKKIILSQNIETKPKLVENNNITDDIRDKNTIHQKVNMVDLELALSYMFRREISQMKDIQGESYNALVQWLTVLAKYFPGREPVMAYLKHLLLKINEQSKGLSGHQFREIIDMKTSDAYLPDDHKQYQHCAGSATKYRGYPCALWLLFHTLTVSQYTKELDSINVIEIPIAIKNYVKYFFGCRQCSDNFMNETMNINQLDLTNKYEAIIYLWTIHNHVNKRLRDDITEDPTHPKVQFPSKHLCKKCHTTNNNNKSDISNTIDFLLKYYSRENIDASLILKKLRLNKNPLTQPKHVISKMDYSNEKIERSGSFITVLQRFSVYIFLGLIVLIILIRRRYCRTKIKRHTI